MKKSILALFVLLFLLIVVCVYQKTYEIYAKDNNNHTAKPLTTTTSTDTHTIKQKELVSQKLIKEEKKVVLSESVKKDIKKHVSEPIEKKVILKKSSATTTAEKNKDETDKVIYAQVEKYIKKYENTPTKKVITSRVTAIKPLDVPIPTATVNASKKPEPKINEKVTSTPSLAKTTKKQDLEEIDSLMEALKDRDTALKNRDELELRIQQLIKKALDDRFTAIAYMNKEELRLLALQKELLGNRDIAYKKIGQINTPKSGE